MKLLLGGRGLFTPHQTAPLEQPKVMVICILDLDRSVGRTIKTYWLVPNFD